MRFADEHLHGRDKSQIVQHHRAQILADQPDTLQRLTNHFVQGAELLLFLRVGFGRLDQLHATVDYQQVLDCIIVQLARDT